MLRISYIVQALLVIAAASSVDARPINHPILAQSVHHVSRYAARDVVGLGIRSGDDPDWVLVARHPPDFHPEVTEIREDIARVKERITNEEAAIRIIKGEKKHTTSQAEELDLENQLVRAERTLRGLKTNLSNLETQELTKMDELSRVGVRPLHS